MLSLSPSSDNKAHNSLISLTLLLRTRPTATSSHHDHRHSRHHHGMESSTHIHKLGNPDIVQTSLASDFSVVMPGHHCPTFIARPAPLPCRREGASWPSHEHSLAQP
ncbi:hypothetical protein BUALT_Bualt15G0090400 [Buddleja alternifolia]|uniref:Uncharacterized protein n=1 Tax=Buddleja alternifolia TaxID=168488 RepID=A0AAV6WPN3_9LAMI|nr:hypothetical protein BUALT_Bualt15G0090400 [Buddleja alternifolia]